MQQLLRKSHTTRRRGHLRVAISTAPHRSGLGRVDMLMRPVASGPRAKGYNRSVRYDTRHVSDTWKCGSFKLCFRPSSRRRIKKKKIKRKCCPSSTDEHKLTTVAKICCCNSWGSSQHLWYIVCMLPRNSIHTSGII